MLRAIPESLLSWTFSLWDGNQKVGEANFDWFKHTGRLKAGDATYQVDPGACGNGPYRLLRGNQVISEAQEVRRFLRNGYVVAYGERQYELKATSLLGRGFEVREGGKCVGRIEPEGAVTRRTRARLPEELPLEVRMFMVGVASVAWDGKGGGDRSMGMR
jgi:hypothetical protein